MCPFSPLWPSCKSSLSAVAASVLNTLTSPACTEYDWLDPTCSLSIAQKWAIFISTIEDPVIARERKV